MIFHGAFLLVCTIQVVQSFTTGSLEISRSEATTTTTTTTTRLSAAAAESNAVVGVTLKIAFDAQGGVADLSAEKSERFTCGESLDMVHRLRRVSDAVLVGRSTVEIDDCTLTVRRVPTEGPQPTRVIVDPKLELDLKKFKIFNDGLDTIVVYAANDESDEAARDKMKDHPDVSFLGLTTICDNGKERLCTKEMCSILASKYNIHHIMVEGGPNTALSFLKDGTVDRAILVYAPIEFKKPLMSNMSTATMKEAGLEEVGSYSSGVDTIKCYSRPDDSWPSKDDISSWP